MASTLVVRDLAGTELASIQGRRIVGKTPSKEIWEAQAKQAQSYIAAEKEIPCGRVAILACNAEGSEALAFFLPAPPEMTFEPWKEEEAASSSISYDKQLDLDTDVLVGALLQFVGKYLQLTNQTLHFHADGFLLEGMWWSGKANMVVTLGDDSSWIGLVSSENDAETHGLTEERALETAEVLKKGPVGILNGQDRMRLCLH